MSKQPSAINEGIDFIEYIEDASNFKVVPHARDPKSFPAIPGTITPDGTPKQEKKPKKKKRK